MEEKSKEFKQCIEEKDKTSEEFKQYIEERDEELKEHIAMQLILNGKNVKNYDQYVLWRKGQHEQSLR